MIFIANVTSLMMSIVTYSAFIVVFAFMAWMAIDAGKQDRFWWVFLILWVPFVGAIAYYFTEKKHEYAKAESHHIHDSATEAQHETSHSEHVHHRKEDVVEEVTKEEKQEEKTEKKKEHKEHREEKVTKEKIETLEEKEEEKAKEV